MCDVCGAAPEWMSGAEKEEKAPRRRKKEPAAAAPVAETSKQKPAPSDELREYMREWRRSVAQRQGVPAFVVLHDTSLDELCRRKPASLAALLQISGVGERKAELYGQQIFAALERFDAGARASAAPEKKISPAEETMRLLAEGRTFAEIAQIRDRQLATVVGLVADLVEKASLEFDPGWVAADTRLRIEEVCARLGFQWLKPIQEALPGISFEEIRLVVADLRRKKTAVGVEHVRPSTG